MEVILLERVAKLGAMGETVRVKNGFARNFLLPQGKALRATAANKEKFERDRASLEARNAERRQSAEGVSGDLDGQSFVLLRQAGESGQLYGSVSSRDIAEAASGSGVSVTRAQVQLDSPIKTIGIYPVEIALHPEVTVTVKINVARTAEEAEQQAQGKVLLGTMSEREEALAAAEALFEEEALANQQDEEGEKAEG
ncbi:MAG: 50S ribosomal protein L9 [Parvibaculaceae bacterium]